MSKGQEHLEEVPSREPAWSHDPDEARGGEGAFDDDDFAAELAAVSRAGGSLATLGLLPRQTVAQAPPAIAAYTVERGYPAGDTAQRALDDAQHAGTA